MRGNSQVSLGRAAFPRCALRAGREKAARAVDLCTSVSGFLGTGGWARPRREEGILNYGFPLMRAYFTSLGTWLWKKVLDLIFRQWREVSA